MNQEHFSYLLLFLVMLAGAAPGVAQTTTTRASTLRMDLYRPKMPDGQRDIEQGSDLHYGRLGRREGLWLVCDRNGGPCANQVIFISKSTLAAARPGEMMVATESIPLAAPTEGWAAFTQRHGGGGDAMAELRRQFENGPRGEGPLLDLEAITIGRSATAPQDNRLFLTTEQPNSFVLECVMTESGASARAVLTACYAYDEKEGTRGDDSNDGLEGIAWSGRPGEFFLVEEGTRAHDPSWTLLFFQRPRLMRCTLRDDRVIIDEAWSNAATQSLWALQTGKTHTLNSAARLDERTVLVADRNGGWLYVADVPSQTVRPWLNLYDKASLDLRTRLAEFPAPRRMPYVSIEGITQDPAGHLWLIDDPAMPEAFRASCLIRMVHPPARPAPPTAQ
ncbi:MAG: hypothetical protein JXA69_01655 [Phycisphaerae bacterium]|nr:hypothetical protein [Phycisphaerae bacterium]